MDDDSQQPNLDFLKDLSFAPGWAKEPPRPQTFESFSAPDEHEGRFERRSGGPRDRRPPRDGTPRDRQDRPERPFRERSPRDGEPRDRQDRPERPFRERPPRDGEPRRFERRPGPPRDGASRDGEPRRFERRPFGADRRPPREPPVDLATLPVEVKFLPEPKALSLVVFKVTHGHRAYPLRDLSRLFLDNPAACSVRFEVRPDQADLFLHQCAPCGLIGTDANLMRDHLLAHFEDYFEKVTVEGDEPAGSFPSIAKCGISGRLIGPPNHHSYALRLRDIKHEVAPGMSDEEYRRRIEIVHDDEVVAQWKQEARIRILFRRKAEKPTEPSAAPAESASAEAESAPAEPVSAEVAAPAEPAPAESAVPAEPAPVEAAAPAEPAPVEEPLLDRGAAEAIFRNEIAPKLLTSRKRATCTLEQARAIRDPVLSLAFRETWRREQHAPISLVFALRGAFRSRKFHVFRAGEGRGIEFVTPKTPVALDVSNAVPELVRVMTYVREHEGCTRADLFSALGIPLEGVRNAEQDKLFQQFAWIVERGHLIEYHNGVLALPSERPFFRDPQRGRRTAPVSAAEGTKDGEKTEAVAPEATETATPEASEATAPEATEEVVPEATEATAPEATEATAPEAAPEI